MQKRGHRSRARSSFLDTEFTKPNLLMGTSNNCHRSSGAPNLPANDSASLIGLLRSSTFRLSTTAVSMSPTGSRFSSESALRPFHHGIRGRGGTIFGSALPLHQRQVQADMRTHLIHRPARDIIPPLGGARVFSYCN